MDTLHACGSAPQQLRREFILAVVETGRHEFIRAFANGILVSRFRVGGQPFRVGANPPISRPISLLLYRTFNGAAGPAVRAFALLDQAVQDRNPQSVYLKVDPRYDLLRSDGRFTALLQRIGL